MTNRPEPLGEAGDVQEGTFGDGHEAVRAGEGLPRAHPPASRPFRYGRPTAAGANGYDASSSSGSNLGPTSQKLADQIQERVAAYRAENGLAVDQPVPADAVTASASGLDPHISPANAALQIDRVAKARHLPVEKVRELVAESTDKEDLGLLGDPGVNVLKLNLALDNL